MGAPPRVRERIYEGTTDPYGGFDDSNWRKDEQGWGSTSRVFATLVGKAVDYYKAYRVPRYLTIVEVGTWKGASALHMARLLRSEGMLDWSEIVCIDTWLGGLEHWTKKDDPNFRDSLDLTFGYPRLYYQFLANVVKAGMENVITPFPNTARTGARMLKHFGVRADLVYIDASHDMDDVVDDLHDYWPLVRPGGTMFGDDYGQWEGVTNAVDFFAEAKSLSVEKVGVKWMIEKTKDV